MNIVAMEYRETHRDRPARPDKVERVRKLVADYDHAADSVAKRQAAVNAVRRLNVSESCESRVNNELTAALIRLRQADDEFDAMILDMADEIKARLANRETAELIAA